MGDRVISAFCGLYVSYVEHVESSVAIVCLNMLALARILVCVPMGHVSYKQWISQYMVLVSQLNKVKGSGETITTCTCIDLT